MGSTGNAGSGYLGPQYEPFASTATAGCRISPTPYTCGRRPSSAASDLLRFMEQEFGQRPQGRAV